MSLAVRLVANVEEFCIHGPMDGQPSSKRSEQTELDRDGGRALSARAEVRVSVSSLGGATLVQATVRVGTRLGKLLGKLYSVCPLPHPCTIALTHAGRRLRLSETFANFPPGSLDLSCVYVSALKPLVGLQCLCPLDLSCVRASSLKHWASLYNECALLEQRGAGDALAYILAYEKSGDDYREVTDAILVAAIAPVLMMLQFEQEQCPEGVMLSASWSTYSILAPDEARRSWQEVRPTEDLCMWDYDKLWECKEDIIEAVFNYVHTANDEVYECKLVWPDQGDGVRMNYRTQHGFTSPAQPASLGIRTARIRR